MKLLFFFSLFSISIHAGENYVVYMGGGGDVKEEKKTIFDVDLHKISGYLNNPFLKKSNVEIVFNGGHADTVQDLKTNFNNHTVKDFNRKNYQETIDKYKALINSGKIKSGDQLFITVDTHGAPNTYNYDYTHQVATGTAHDGSENVSIDALRSLADLAKAKGVKLAIADLSCYSGLSIKLGNDSTCVISSTGPAHYSFKSDNTFSANFLSSLRPGKNLEAVFLSAREESEDRGYPMISTAEDDYILRNIYPALSPYLYFKDDKGKGTDSIDHYLFQDISNEQLCKRQKSFSNLLSLIEQIEKDQKFSVNIFSYEFVLKEANYDRLKKLLKETKKDYDAILVDFLKFKNLLKDKVAVNYLDGSNHSMKMEYTLEQIFSSDYSAQLKKEKDNPNGSKSLINLYQSIISKQEELKKQNPKLVSTQQKLAELGLRIKNSATNSYRIAQEEKRLYSAVYKAQASYRKTSNPCRDFVL